MNKNVALYNEMIAFFAGDARRCQHFIKVASLAKQLAESEAADAELTELVEAAGLVHDCGIKPGEAKYGAGHCTGKIQEQEGPAVARELLQKVGYAPEKIERICYLVGHHHTYNMIDGLDYQLLVEADFIVNFYEDGTPKENIAKAVERVLKLRAERSWLRLCSDFDIKCCGLPVTAFFLLFCLMLAKINKIRLFFGGIRYEGNL